MLPAVLMPFMEISKNTLFLKGILKLNDVPLIMQHYSVLPEDIKVLDLTQVIESDSSLLALLIEYQRQSPQLKIVNMPQPLRHLMNVYQMHDCFNE